MRLTGHKTSATGSNPVLPSNSLAKYAEALAVQAGLGGLLVGTLFVAGSTSLPELITLSNAIKQGKQDVAAGNQFEIICLCW